MRQLQKKWVLALMLVGTIAMSCLTACSFEKTCKEAGCNETSIYKDGYCKYHYYINTGEDILKNAVNKGEN